MPFDSQQSGQTRRERIVRDFSLLKKLQPIDCPEINDFIRTRALSVFVDDAWNIWHKDLAAWDNSFQRSLQEIVRKVRSKHTDPLYRPKINAVETATWESFETLVSSSNNKEQLDEAQVEEQRSNQKVKETLDQIIDYGGSDLHIQLDSRQNTTTVKMRINGVMVQTNNWDFPAGDSFLRALWNLQPGLNRAESNINNGSFYYDHSRTNKSYMVRVTESPEVRGLKFTARIRDPSEIRPLDSSGYTSGQQTAIYNILGSRSGLICINGPTNSGKSTTQTSMLANMPKDLSIVEIGDPVETHIPGLTHIELSDSYQGGKNAHLQKVLGSTVRADPDMLALTEMRDSLTAEAAKALTSQGKLVITTMHCEDFITAFPRLKIFGLLPDEILTPGFLRAFISQKLLPKLCPACSLTDITDTKLTSRIMITFDAREREKLRFRNSAGCPQCRHSGYSDRVLCAEVVEFNAEVLAAARDIIDKSDTNKWLDYAEKHGIINVHQHAYYRCKAGEVDVSDVEKYIGRFNEQTLRHMYRGKKKKKPAIPDNIAHIAPSP